MELETMLMWFGYVRRNDDGYIGRWMLMMELQGHMKRGGFKRNFMKGVIENMAVVEVTEENAKYKTK